MVSDFCKKIGFRWFNISFDLDTNSSEAIHKTCDFGYKILQTFENAFVNFIFPNKYVCSDAFLEVAKTIKKVANLKQNGIDNFRLGASFNTQPNTPFFPFSYSNKENSFSLALETVEYLEHLIKENKSKDYSMLNKYLVDELTKVLSLIEQVSIDFQDKFSLKYNGMDISLAPYPEEDVSVISLHKLLGLQEFGASGTQFFTAYLTSVLKETIDKSKLKFVGFNGVMYSVLEDKLLCEANEKGLYTLDSLLLYSTVCGCGFDMIPLPGEISCEELYAMMLDIAVTSVKLNKPLGFRVLPIPNKYAGEETELELDFITNTKIIKTKDIKLDGQVYSLNNIYTWPYGK